MAMDEIKPGLSYDLEDAIELDQTINRTDKPGADVLSTPSLLALMEWSSIKSTDHLLPDDRTTVGYAVDGMRHLAPTALGSKVVVKSVLTEVDGVKLTYGVEAYEGDKLIGRAIHKRAIVPIT
jgi:fluoroacetyl-CoA thioesterase